MTAYWNNREPVEKPYSIFSLSPLIFFVLLLFPASSHAAISTVWRWQVGDDPAWAAPDFDDVGWAHGEPPEPITLMRYPYRGWYRLHFTLPPERPEGGWGIALGRIQTADEAYLNGVFIGGEGVIQDQFVDALHKKRVYALPDEFLRTDGNVLAVRVQSSVMDGGLIGARTGFGDQRVLQANAARQALHRKLLEAFFLGMLSIALAFWFLLMLFRERQSEYVYFGMLVGLFTATTLMESLLWYDAGWATPLTQRLTIGLYLMLPVPFLLFGAHLLQGLRSPSLHRGLALLCLVMGVAYAFFGGLQYFRLVETVWWLILLITGALLVWQGWRLRVWKQSAAPLALAVGIGLLLLFALLDQFLAGGWAGLLPFGALLYLGFACLVVSLACALALRFQQFNERLRSLSHQILSAQEVACKRAAAMLHGELAPTLAAAKLDLQMFLRKYQLPDEGTRLVEQLSAAIDRARTLSHEMHPVEVEQLGLARALKALAERLAQVNGWTLHSDLTDRPVLSTAHAILLYRMGQELLYNVAKHAEARNVFLTLSSNAQGAHLSVRDDGKGCNPRTATPGIGWFTLCERTEALQGRCEVIQPADGGLEARIWIPHA